MVERSNKFLKIFFIITFISIYGCAPTVGNMPQSTGASVGLSGNNFKIIKVGAKGESKGFSLLGLIPLVSPTWEEAKVNLYKSIGQKVEGRSIGLTNQTEDRNIIYLILFSLPKITITADVVEFIAPATPQK
jgi:hypothetical protein